MGAAVTVEAGEAFAAADRLRGAEMTLTGAFGSSVGATINAMLAAAVTPGVTRIYGAAQEPDVWEVAALLNRAGARIAGAGTSTVEIEGVRRLEAVAYDVPGDRIEASTFLLAGAATGGDVRVDGLAAWTLGPVPRLLEQMGCEVAVEPTAVRVMAPGAAAGAGRMLTAGAAAGPTAGAGWMPTAGRPSAGRERLRAVQVETGPFPALPTDVQPVLVAPLCGAAGDSVVGERVFDARFGYTRELERFGARIRVGGNTAVISGVERLSGAPVAGSDLRATAALVVAALAAEGESTVEGLAYLDRGYEGLEAKFGALGGAIRRDGGLVSSGINGL
jgi:UDP-N-acetylglucosamine 1-carboxyvinyltransferase